MLQIKYTDNEKKNRYSPDIKKPSAETRNYTVVTQKYPPHVTRKYSLTVHVRSITRVQHPKKRMLVLKTTKEEDEEEE